MPARIVVVHDGPCLERIISGLSQRGHDVRGYSDPLAALSALEDARRVEGNCSPPFGISQGA
jgi:hypothetical protein